MNRCDWLRDDDNNHMITTMLATVRVMVWVNCIVGGFEGLGWQVDAHLDRLLPVPTRHQGQRLVFMIVQHYFSKLKAVMLLLDKLRVEAPNHEYIIRGFDLLTSTWFHNTDLCCNATPLNLSWILHLFLVISEYLMLLETNTEQMIVGLDKFLCRPLVGRFEI